MTVPERKGDLAQAWRYIEGELRAEEEAARVEKLSEAEVIAELEAVEGGPVRMPSAEGDPWAGEGSGCGEGGRGGCRWGWGT